METIGNILNQYLKDLGIDKPIKRYAALKIWPDIVGERIAKVTEAQSVSKGKLFIRVQNDVWRTELVYHKPLILKKLNKALGSNVIEDIILI